MINFFRLFAILLRNVELTYLEGGITDTEVFGNDDHNKTYLVFKTSRHECIWLIKYAFVSVSHVYVSHKKFIFLYHKFATLRLQNEVVSVDDKMIDHVTVLKPYLKLVWHLWNEKTVEDDYGVFASELIFMLMAQWNVIKTARFEVGSKIKEGLWTGLISLQIAPMALFESKRATFLSLKTQNHVAWNEIALKGTFRWMPSTLTWLSQRKQALEGACAVPLRWSCVREAFL